MSTLNHKICVIGLIHKLLNKMGQQDTVLILIYVKRLKIKYNKVFLSTMKPMLRDYCHERPPVLKDHTVLAEGPACLLKVAPNTTILITSMTLLSTRNMMLFLH